MIQVAFDWNCIIALEEDRPSAPALRQIQAWYNQGKIGLCISSSSRLENPQSRDNSVIDEEEWKEKMRVVGLTGIELRPARTRAFSGPMTFDFDLDQLIMREIHNLLFPNIDFYIQDYYRRLGLKPIDTNGKPSLRDANNAASDEQRQAERKWNNAKCDALSLNAFSTWSEIDDIFVTDDKNFLQKRELLKQPFRIQRQVLAPPPGYTETFEEPVALTELTQILVISEIIKGHIMSPQEAVEYLHQRLED